MALLPPGTSTTAQTPTRLNSSSTPHIPCIHYCLNALTHTHNKFSSHHIPWIIDTGATDHMIYCPSFFTTITSIASHLVALPNGTHVPATHTSKIQLTPSICLTQVLCVPSFNFNLILVKKMTTNLTCSVIFFSNLFVIQDLLSWTTIGKGEVRNGLYHFACQHQRLPFSPCRTCAASRRSSTLKENVKGLSRKYEKTRNSCLLLVKKLNRSRHLVFWSLGTLTGFRDGVWRLVA